MNSFETLTQDNLGNDLLIIKGDWTEKTDKIFNESRWDKLVIFGVEWADYQPLLPYKEKIKWLSVPLGPDSSKGLMELEFLEKLELGDRILPAIDFRNMENLRFLSLNIDKKFPINYLNNALLMHLVLDGFPEKNLLGLDNLQNLTSLEIKKGSLRSIRGIEQLHSLKTLKLVKTRMLSDISDIPKASALENVFFDNISKLEDVSELFMLKKLKNLEVSGNKVTLDDTKLIANIGLIEYLHLYFDIEVVNWEDFLSLKNLKSLSVSSKINTLTDDEIKELFICNGMKIDTFDKLELTDNSYIIEFENYN